MKSINPLSGLMVYSAILILVKLQIIPDPALSLQGLSGLYGEWSLLLFFLVISIESIVYAGLLNIPYYLLLIAGTFLIRDQISIITEDTYFLFFLLCTWTFLPPFSASGNAGRRDAGDMFDKINHSSIERAS